VPERPVNVSAPPRAGVAGLGLRGQGQEPVQRASAGLLDALAAPAGLPAGSAIPLGAEAAATPLSAEAAAIPI
jgi:hypothetical protein